MKEESIDYSVVIRTIGTAHKKYQALLDSIEQLDPQPKEIIVVLPEGFKVPAEQLGHEHFYYSKKGMLAQRLKGIEVCKTDYALICDDDVSFPADFVAKLYEPVSNGMCGMSAAPLLSFLPEKGIRSLIDMLSGNAMPTVFHKKRYNSVLKSTGYSYNRKIDVKHKVYYETQSIPWTCFFADIAKLRAIRLEEEIWIDKNGYAAMDDQTATYKAWLNGIKTIVVSDAFYEHLDGMTSRRNNKPSALYSLPFNRIVFWQRFIYEVEDSTYGKMTAKLFFKYRLICNQFMNQISFMRGKLSMDDIRIIKKGLQDGWAYINSDEYHSLPSVYSALRGI